MNLTSGNFKEVVNNNEVVLVDFWAPWCGPCRTLGPVIDELSKKHTNKVYKINVDQERELATQFQVRGIPNVMIFKGGKVVESITGVRPPSFYEEKLNYYSN